MKSIDDAVARLRETGDLFLKPSVGISSGIGCRLVHAENGVDALSGGDLPQYGERLYRAAPGTVS